MYMHTCISYIFMCSVRFKQPLQDLNSHMGAKAATYTAVPVVHMSKQMREVHLQINPIPELLE